MTGTESPVDGPDNPLTDHEVALFGRIYAMSGEPALLRVQMDGRDVAVVVEVTAEAEDRTQLAPLAVLVDAEILGRLRLDGAPLGASKNDTREANDDASNS